MLQSQTDTCLQETGTLEHRQIRNTLKSQNTISKAFSSLYLSESIAKLEITQYKRLARSKYNKNSMWVLSGNNTITNLRQTHGTVRKSHTTITKH